MSHGSNPLANSRPLPARSLTQSLNSNIGLSCASAPGLYKQMNDADDVYPELKNPSIQQGGKRSHKNNDDKNVKRKKN